MSPGHPVVVVVAAVAAAAVVVSSIYLRSDSAA